MFRVIESTTVPTVPLDEMAVQHGFADACFLKLDTQGTELDILRSGSRLVHDSLVGIHAECLFRPFYEGQALFSDIDSHLRSKGFSLFSLSRTNLRRADYRASFYSKRVIAWAHCLYLREPQTLLTADSEALRRGMPRLLAIALAFQQYDLSFEIVEMLGNARILAGNDVKRLVGEVERVATIGTERMLRKAKEKGLEDLVMAPNFRDKKRFE